jgi:hypothetical protein
MVKLTSTEAGRLYFANPAEAKIVSIIITCGK